MLIRFGTRASPLAIFQTELFISKLKEVMEFEYEIIKIKTSGDKILNKPLYDIGGKALFVKELENALTEGAIDIAVHSLKDIPGRISDEFIISGFIGKECPHDCLLSEEARSIGELRRGAVIGTSSPRRIAFLKNLRPDLEIKILRGNINTRIKKLSEGEYDAIILAEAGLKRGGLYNEKYCHIIPVEDVIPAVGQGVIAGEILQEREDLKKILNKIAQENIAMQVAIEREFLYKINADCDVPVAGFVTDKGDDKIKCEFMLANSDMENMQIYREFHRRNEQALGNKIANILLNMQAKSTSCLL